MLLGVILLCGCANNEVKSADEEKSIQKNQVTNNFVANESEFENKEIIEESEIVISDKENIKKIEISMEEAIDMCIKEAPKYYDNLQITCVHSYDNDEYRSELAGADGKRQWWYVSFANEKLNYVDILVCDGQIEAVVPIDENGHNGLIDLSDVNMTAEEAVKKAQEMGLRGGNPNNEDEWVSGYNFKMSYASLVSSPDDKKIFLEVIGISPNGNFAHIDFDATTGEVILSEEKIEYPNGDAEWKEF